MEAIIDDFIDIDEDDVLQELGFDTARAVRSFCCSPSLRGSRGLVIGSLISVMTRLVSKLACYRSSIWVLSRLPLLQPGQSVAPVLSLKPIAALRRLSR